MIRKRKKSSKKKGLMSHASQKHRGSGNRGGVGRSGRGKKGSQKRTKDLALGIKLGKKKGFVKPRQRKVKTINLSDLMKHVKEGKVETKYKVLSKGNALPGVKVIAKAFSKKAKIKIENAKGQAIVQ